ncbi:MAG: hypothetical protein VR72_00960 [Clostridiaceae bacterium BRH_c20a]|nr:MAG: hypothetical protein VR72_00960 [Clostridiaceae bacterium BRH_c20a]
MFKHLNKFMMIFLIFVITTGVLFGAYFLYKQFFVNQPLSETLDNSELISEYQFIQDRNKPLLKIKLNQAENFAELFQGFLTSSGRVLTEKDLELQLSSNPNAKLLDFYQEIHPSLFEAAVLGNYSKLQQKIKDENINSKLSKAGLTISANYIILELEDADRYLYYVLNRVDNSFPRIINNIGSDI